MALALGNISVELREISLKNRPGALLNISPKGTVPVLYINQNTILEESMDIINGLKRLPEYVEKILSQAKKIEKIAEKYYKSR